MAIHEAKCDHRSGIIVTGPTMATTAVATTITTTCSEVHGTTTMSRAKPFKLARGQAQAVPSNAYDTKVITQASHSHASRTEQPTPRPSLILRPSLLPRPSLFPPSSPFSWSSLIPWPSLFSPSSLLPWPSLLSPSSLFPWPSLLPWPFK
ncbi:hypothetical protein ACFX1X_019660 [Malus domestica]